MKMVGIELLRAGFLQSVFHLDRLIFLPLLRRASTFAQHDRIQVRALCQPIPSGSSMDYQIILLDL